MPVRVKGPDGNTYSFPDGTDKNAAIAYFKKKGIGAPPPATPPEQPSAISRFASSQLDALKSGAKGIAQFLDPRPTDEEKSVAAKSGPVANAYDAFMRYPERLIAGNVEEATKAGDTSLTPMERTGHGLAAVIPLVGPWAASVGEKMGQQAGTGDYAGAAGTLAGNAEFGVVTDTAGRAAGQAPKIPGKVADLIKPGTRTTKELVKTTEAANAAEAAEAAEKNAATEAKRKIDLKKHFDKTQAVREANTAKDAAASRKTALEKGVKRLDPEVKEGLEATRDKVNKEANAKYTALAEKLDPIEANPEFLPKVVDEAFQKIKGSDSEPTILKDMARKTQHGDVLTYRDLQGYRSEIGKELSKGSLPGDIFHAYKDLQTQVTDEMQRIADSSFDEPLKPFGKDAPPVPRGYVRLYRAESPSVSFHDVFNADNLQANGFPKPPEGTKTFTADPDYADYYRQTYGKDAKVFYIDVPESAAKSAQSSSGDYFIDPNKYRQSMGPQFKEARDFYRRYAETFIDRGSPVRKAVESTERGGVAKALRGKDQSGIEAVAQFDPDVARKANTVRGHADEAAAIKPSATRTAEPTLSPKPAKVIPKVSKIGEAENVAANKEALARRTDAIRNRGGTWANTFVILDSIRNLISGNMAGLAHDVEARVAFGAGKTALANLLEKPSVVEFLTKTTPEQIAAIPPDLRGDFPAIIQAAQSQGIQISPALAAAFAPKKRVGDLIK